MDAPAREEDIDLTADPNVEGLVLDVDRFATHDGPGIRTAVFLKGCPLACRWCHSPESRGPRPELLFRRQRCTGCGLCIDVCPHAALSLAEPGGRVDLDRGRVDLDRGRVDLDRGLCTDCARCVDVCYPGALTTAGYTISAGALVDEIARDHRFFESSGGGVTISGGEPALQPEFTYQVLLECRRRGVHTAVETTGYAPAQHVLAIASVCDLVMYDLKLADDAMHRRYVGASNAVILENLALVADRHPDVVVRVPCIPGVNDDEDQIREIARAALHAGVSRIVLLAYNGAAGAKYEWLGRPFILEGSESQSDDVMEALAAVCRDVGPTVEVGG